MRQVVSLWLPRFATDLWWRNRRARNSPGRPGGAPARGGPAGVVGPLVLVTSVQGRLLLAAVDAAAERDGLAPGMPLADARALLPGVRTAAYDAAGDAAALTRLADWCGRYSPWAAVDGCGCDIGGSAGILLDVTGCAHLFGGEAALLSDLIARLQRLGFTARAALAETAGAAWAVARFAVPTDSSPGDSSPGASADPRCTVLPPGAPRAALAPLPPAALRLPPATCELLARLGLRTIGDLFDLPPAALAPRFGPQLARRLAAALGSAAESISPRQPVPPFLVRQVFAEPIAAAADIARGLDGLLPRLCRVLETAQQGARRLELAIYRVDGTVRRRFLGASRPTRDPAHLRRLFANHLEAIDPGFGIEVMTLSAPVADALSALQLTLSGAGTDAGTGAGKGGAAADVIGDLPALIDRLGSRLGLENVRALVPRESHIPERAVTALPALVPRPAWSLPVAASPARPLRLLPRPEPVEAVALLPDHPPARFRWRRLLHRIVRAEGPERIEPEWWVDAPAVGPVPSAARDYFRLEAEDGRRYWLYRTAGQVDGEQADGGRWFLHGLFA